MDDEFKKVKIFLHEMQRLFENQRITSSKLLGWTFILGVGIQCLKCHLREQITSKSNNLQFFGHIVTKLLGHIFKTNMFWESYDAPKIQDAKCSTFGSLAWESHDKWPCHGMLQSILLGGRWHVFSNLNWTSSSQVRV